MEIAELLLKAWPVLLGLITLIIVLSKLDLRMRSINPILVD